MSSNLYNAPGVEKRRAVDAQDFMAVILVGYGDNLHPFNEDTKVVPKALLPVGNVPIINSVLNWVLDSGLTDILIVAPPLAYSAVHHHLQEHYSVSTHPRARIDLKRLTDGEKDEDEKESDIDVSKGGQKEGTARILRRFRAMIKSDFILLPCDLLPPTSLPLSSILDKHRATPTAVLTSVFYEPVPSIKEAEQKVLIAIDKETQELLMIENLMALEEDLSLRTTLLALHPTLSLSTRLIDAHIYVFRRTILDLLATRRSKDLDSMKEQVVPWLVKGGWQRALGERWAPILNPPRRDPLASALGRSTAAHIPSAAAYAYPSRGSSSGSDHTPPPMNLPTSPNPDDGEDLSAFKEALAANIHAPAKRNSHGRRKYPGWKCQVIITAPELETPPPSGKAAKGKPKAASEPDYLIRANNLPAYWELNRRFLRSMAISSTPSIPTPPSPRNAVSGVVSEDTHSTVTPISPSAQISPDSLIGEGTRVGERASIKKSVIGRHCVIGKGAKITGCVLWDFASVEENARVENAILGNNVRIGEKSTIKDCELGTRFEAKPGSNLKNEKLVAGQEASS
ncbi:translation initiation factor eIF-2B subunit gamma, partial [Tremellales sp. Uapishka_1]